MNRLFLILTTALTLAGCTEKPDFFEFDLRVVDNNGNPVSGATVAAFYQPAGTNGANEPFVSAGNYVSGTAGRINLEIDKQSIFSYRFDVSRSGYFDESISVSPDDVPFTSAYVADLQIHGQSWIDLHLMNAENSIAVFFTVEADTPGCSDCCDGSEDHRTGIDVDEHVICTMFSDQVVGLSGFVTDSLSVVNHYDHTFTAVQGDTIHFLLAY